MSELSQLFIAAVKGIYFIHMKLCLFVPAAVLKANSDLWLYESDAVCSYKQFRSADFCPVGTRYEPQTLSGSLDLAFISFYVALRTTLSNIPWIESLVIYSLVDQLRRSSCTVNQ
jgi:hypothetical protein